MNLHCLFLVSSVKNVPESIPDYLNLLIVLDVIKKGTHKYLFKRRKTIPLYIPFSAAINLCSA